MKKLLKFSALALIILMVGFLASCSGGHESSSDYKWSDEPSVITENVIKEEIIYEEVIR